MTKPSIGRVKLDDVPRIVQMVRDSFSKQVRPYMIYDQPGMADFLSIPMQYPSSESDRVLLAMTSVEGLLGFADFRLLGNGRAFLSYICVASEARGRGLATSLINSFLEDHPHITELGLDVFPDNRAARALYTKLGFETCSTSAWITRKLPEPRGTAFIASLPVAISAFRAHGFCELDVTLGAERITIGRIGEHVLRCPSMDSFENDALLSSLRNVFHEVDQAFAVVPVENLPDIKTSHHVITLSDRMLLQLHRHGRKLEGTL